MKTMLAISIGGLVFGATATSLLAQAGGVVEVGWERYGVTGLMGAVLMYLLVKFIPKLQEDFKEALREVTDGHEKAAAILAADAKAAAVKVAEINATSAVSLSSKLDDLIQTQRQTTSEVKAAGDSQLALMRQVVLGQKKAEEK
jgi:hypothetical protein